MEHDISKGYTITNGFAFTAISYPFNVHDAIIVKCKGVSDCERYLSMIFLIIL